MVEDKNRRPPDLLVITGNQAGEKEREELVEAARGARFSRDPVEVARLMAVEGSRLVVPADPTLLRDLATLIEKLLTSAPGTAAGVRARAPRPHTHLQLYEDAVAYVEQVLEQARDGNDPDVDRGRVIAERIHTDLLRDNRLVNRSLEPHDSYDLPAHCVNVAVLGGKIALGMVSGVEDAVAVVHAGLLHDIGMARLPASMLRNTGVWSPNEREAMRKHPEEGAEILARSAPRAEWLRRAVLQEHERFRGQGYPHGLRGDEIDPIARILGVADVFEALSHPRSYRSPYTALEALERVAGMQEEYFSSQVVASLINEISAFPLDSFVQLSTGEIGRVVATDPTNMLRPRVELVWDSSWKPIEAPYALDLAERPDISVARALLEAELPIT